MNLLLDTVVVSELRRSRHPDCDPVFAAWAESVDLSDCFISVLTLHEMERGVLLVERKDPLRGLVYRGWLDDVRDAYHGRILPLTAEAAIIAAGLHVPDPAPLTDSLIAGTAMERGLAVATRNVSDFARFGIQWVNPWFIGN